MKLKRLKSLGALAALLLSSPSYAEPQQIEVCIKARYDYQWGMPLVSSALFGTHNQFNQVAGVEILPSGQYVLFDFGDEEVEDMQMIKLNGVLSSSYQEGEGQHGDRWLVARKLPQQICRQ